MIRRAHKVVAAVAVILALACVAVMVEVGRREYSTLGPTHAIAAADGSLYVVSHGALHVFGPAGERRERIDLAALGVTPKPSDIALHRDGRIVFVDPDTSLLRRCLLPRGPCEALDLGLQRGEVQELMPLNAAKLAIDDASGRYYVSDNAAYRIVIADFSGRVLARSRPGLVRHPNHLFLSAPGELTVVDTDRHRIITVDVRGDRVGALLHEVDAGASGVTRPDRRLPFDTASLPAGETAVLIADSRMRDADLVVLDAAGTAVRRIDLGSDSDPFDIERWKDRIVVADGTRYALQAVDFHGHADDRFPGADFAAELAQQRERVERLAQARLGARIALILVPIVAIGALMALGAD